VRTAFKQNFVVKQYVVQGKMVAGIWCSSVTHHGDFLGIPATSKHFTVRGITAYEIENDKIISHCEQFDQVGIMRELGLISV
jgi:predicted ester cyclase